MTTTEEPTADEPIWVHVTFRWPIRVLLWGKSTPVIAVNGQITSLIGDATLEIQIKQIYQASQVPAILTAIAATGTLFVPIDNIAGRLMVKDLPE